MSIPAPSTITQTCKASSIGKLLPDALYIHESALAHLCPTLQAYEAQARQFLQRDRRTPPITLIKIHLDRPRISYLHYPDFFSEPHPALHSSLIIDLPSAQFPQGQLHYHDYSQRPNPPILHRKETFLHPSHPRYAEFAELTRQQEALGLLDQTATIGTRKGWQKRLQEHHIQLHGHHLACPWPHPNPPAPQPPPPPSTTKALALSESDRQTQNRPSRYPAELSTANHQPIDRQPIDRQPIDRHKAAIVRPDLSKPIRLALEAGLFSSDTTFFDYGCGHGGDLQRLTKLGYTTQGWDPYYRPDSPQIPADIVNLGYILNVIENQAERRQALLHAWSLTQKVLIVAAQVLIDDINRGWISYEDGVITSRNTFQKYYEQEELKRYIDQVLNSLDSDDPSTSPIDAIPIAPGIYVIFRDPTQAQTFRASRFRSRATTPRIRTHIRRFEDYQDLLQPLMAFYTDRGRLPLGDEQTHFTDLKTQFGTLRNAFTLILQATDPNAWDHISDQRRNDLLVYLALSHFSTRPKLKDLDTTTQNDLKGLFGSYHQACAAADLMLLSLSNQDHIREHIHQSPIGHKTTKHLLIHPSLLDHLDPLLRLYEGCAARTYGRPENTTVIKLHATSPKITYLTIPDFDTDPHPPIHTALQIHLRNQRLHYHDHHDSPNPPILHRKDQLVGPDYPHYRKFAKLSQQEQAWGLLENLEALSHHRDWQTHLQNHHAQHQGHRLTWRKDTDPYQRKLKQAQHRNCNR